MMISKKIQQTRLIKGWTQEDLSERSKINIRTIQRIESGNYNARNKTLQILYEALGLEWESSNQKTQKLNFLTLISDLLFLILANLAIMCVFGFLTLEQNANINSVVGAYLLAIFLPLIIVVFTQHMNNSERLYKFGFGIFGYLIFIAIRHKFPVDLNIKFYPVLILVLLTLYYGKIILKQSE